MFELGGAIHLTCFTSWQLPLSLCLAALFYYSVLHVGTSRHACAWRRYSPLVFYKSSKLTMPELYDPVSYTVLLGQISLSLCLAALFSYSVLLVIKSRHIRAWLHYSNRAFYQLSIDFLLSPCPSTAVNAYQTLLIKLYWLKAVIYLMLT